MADEVQKPVEVTDASSRVTVRHGQHLRLTLPETPTTGYRWRLTEACAQHLDLQSDDATASTDRPGAPGERVWVFATKTAGTCELKLESARPWEKGVTGKTLAIQVEITPE